MKQIVAIVKPFLAERVVASIADKQVEEISIREVKGYGRQKNYLDQYGENEYSLAFVPKVEGVMARTPSSGELRTTEHTVLLSLALPACGF